MPNHYSGTCYRCGREVLGGEGHFERIRDERRGEQGGRRWRVQHAACALAARREQTAQRGAGSQRKEVQA